MSVHSHSEVKNGRAHRTERYVLSLNIRDLVKHDPLPLEDELRLGILARFGDEEAQQGLILHNGRFAVKLAYSYANYGLEMSDLLQEALLGFCEAIPYYEPARGVRFITYAAWHARARIIDALNAGRMIRRPNTVTANIRRLGKEENALFHIHGREPMDVELSVATGISLGEVQRLLEIRRGTVHSLTNPVSDENDTHLIEVTQDRSEISPEVLSLARGEHVAMKKALDRLVDATRHLSPLERKLFLFRFGLDDGSLTVRPSWTAAKHFSIGSGVAATQTNKALRRVRCILKDQRLTDEHIRHTIQRFKVLHEALVD